MQKRKLSRPDFERSRAFLHEHARVLERRVFERLFESGGVEPVHAALAAYRNSDGGFGHALEPDARVAASQPLFAEFALRTLALAEADAIEEPAALCAFLEKATTAEGGVPSLFANARSAARAAHWTEPDPRASLAATGMIAGTLRRFGVAHPWLERATQFCVEKIRTGAIGEAHAVRGGALVCETVEPGLARELEPRLEAALRDAQWFALDPPVQRYALTPLDFAPTPDAPFVRWFGRERIEAHLDDLLERRADDGGWPVLWVPPPARPWPSGGRAAPWRRCAACATGVGSRRSARGRRGARRSAARRPGRSARPGARRGSRRRGSGSASARSRPGSSRRARSIRSARRPRPGDRDPRIRGCGRTRLRDSQGPCRRPSAARAGGAAARSAQLPCSPRPGNAHEPDLSLNARAVAADPRGGLEKTARQGSSVATVADLLADVCAEFARDGALGALYVDCAPLDEVERRYGEEAHLRTLASVADVVGGACVEILGEREPVARGEIGRSELSASSRASPATSISTRSFSPRWSARCASAWRATPSVSPTRTCARFRRSRSAARSRCATRSCRRLTQVRDADRRRARRRGPERAPRRSARGGASSSTSSLQGKLFSVYEPVVDAKTLTVFGYEALVRGSEGSGLASPAELFGTAAEEGLLFELDCQCRRAAVEGSIGFPAGAKLFMNIRPTAIHDPSFQPDALTRTLDRCGLAPSDVVFEISEQESIDNYTIFREARDDYGKLGFQFALDDTGAGYASLEAVLELTPEFIKVDRAFVHGIDQDPVAPEHPARVPEPSRRTWTRRSSAKGSTRSKSCACSASSASSSARAGSSASPRRSRDRSDSQPAARCALRLRPRLGARARPRSWRSARSSSGQPSSPSPGAWSEQPVAGEGSDEELVADAQRRGAGAHRRAAFS